MSGEMITILAVGVTPGTPVPRQLFTPAHSPPHI